jgi:hypothetical protein
MSRRTLAATACRPGIVNSGNSKSRGHQRTSMALRLPTALALLAAFWATTALAQGTPTQADPQKRGVRGIPVLRLPQPGPPILRVTLVRLTCLSINDVVGEDEVYYFYGGTDGNGAKVQGQGPEAYQSADGSDHHHWDMKEGQRRDLNVVLYQGELKPGQTARLRFYFVESDGTDYGGVAQAAAKVAGAIFTGHAELIGAIGDLFKEILPKNEDDPLGAFELHIANHSGVLYPRVTHLEYGDQFWHVNTFTFHFRHDDGDYIAEIKLDQGP